MKAEYWQDLGRRAVACEYWRWLPGMLCIPVGGGLPIRYNGIPSRDMSSAGNVRYIPNFRDPATLGCLLALVREIHGDDVHTTPDNTGCGWWVEGLSEIGLIHATEAEALVAALEAAP